jgi:acyl-coenzyme A thioesterase PaaI-like protein
MTCLLGYKAIMPEPESLATSLWRRAFNFFPAYFGSGAHVVHIAGDWREIHVALPLSVRTRNYVGTIFGGSMYAAVDPVYMLMLIKNLGPDYVVWDREARIRFLKPGRSTLHARFRIEAAELEAIRAGLETTRSIDRVYQVELVDAAGTICAAVEKTLYVRKKRPDEKVSAGIIAWFRAGASRGTSR